MVLVVVVWFFFFVFPGGFSGFYVVKRATQRWPVSRQPPYHPSTNLVTPPLLSTQQKMLLFQLDTLSITVGILFCKCFDVSVCLVCVMNDGFFLVFCGLLFSDFRFCLCSFGDGGGFFVLLPFLRAQSTSICGPAN